MFIIGKTIIVPSLVIVVALVRKLQRGAQCEILSHFSFIPSKKKYLKSKVLAQSNRDDVCWTGKWIVYTFLQQADNIKKIRLILNHLVESKCYFFSLAKNFSKEFLFSIMNTFQTNCSATVKVFIFSKHSILKIY